MVRQEDFPEEWVCDSPNKRVKVEVRVPIDPGPGVVAVDEDTFEWIEIPTMEVEQYVTKGDAAAIQRSAKVRFPTEWGGDSPHELVQQYSNDQQVPMMWARVSYREQGVENAPWVVTLFGWIGGLGPASDEGVSKMWVYDPAELLSGTRIGATFNEMSVKQAAEKIARLTNDNTPIPLSEVHIVPPETEEEFALVAEAIEEEGIVGSTATEGTPSEGEVLYAYDDAGERRTRPLETGENFEAAIIETKPDAFLSVGTKTFKSNRHSLQDVYEYLEERINGKIHFVPQPDGRSVRLMVDIVPERHVFAQEEVFLHEQDQPGAYRFYDTVEVMKNDALYEMKPINTVHVDGDENIGFLDDAVGWAGETAGDIASIFNDKKPPSKKYPYAKVRVPSIYQAAEGVELGPHVDSDANTEAKVIEAAKKEMREILEETTEGEIVMKGNPFVQPYDRVDAFEVCDDRVIFEQDPVRYEVESVKHTASANDIYTTRVLVSIWVGDENIVVVESGMATAATTEGDN